jgi:hypothetical protein
VVDGKNHETNEKTIAPAFNRLGGVARPLTIAAALSLGLTMAPSAQAEVVQAPETSGQVTFTLPGDTPHPVTFSLKGWVCVNGNLEQAAGELRRLLEKTPPSARPDLLGLDLVQALTRLTGLEIVKDPSVVVPAPGQKILTPCFDADTWPQILAQFENLVTQTPYRLATTVAQGQQPAGGVFVRPTGAPGFISIAPNARPESAALLPDGQFVSGGKPIGRVSEPGQTSQPKRTARETEANAGTGQPVVDKQGTLVGHLQTNPDGSTYFAPLSAPGAMPAVPQKVEVLPGGHVVWGGIPVGDLGRPEQPAPPASAPEQTTGQPIYDKDGSVIGRLQTSPDGTQYFAPDAPPGGMQPPPQKVEVFPDGTVIWSGMKIGSLNRQAKPAAQPLKQPAKPATLAKAKALPPMDAEQSALAHIDALKKARADETAEIKALQARKDQLNAKILGLLANRDLTAKDRIDGLVKQAEAEWQALTKQQYRHYDTNDRLRLALERARAALPKARARAKAQRRAQMQAEFADTLNTARRPLAAFSPVAALLANLDKSLGEKQVDRIIAAFKETLKETTKPPSPLGFLNFLRGWLEENTTGNPTLSLDYLSATTRILQDPGRMQLWGVKASDLPALRAGTIAEIDRALLKLVYPKVGETTPERLRRAYAKVDLRLLQWRLSRGKKRMDRAREVTAELAKLQATIQAVSAKDSDIVASLRAEYASQLRRWFVTAQSSETPFGKAVARVIAAHLGQNLEAWANAGSSPDAASAARYLGAAQAYAAGGDTARALGQSRLAEQTGDAATVFKARLQQLMLLRDMLRRERYLSTAEKRMLSLFGPEKNTHDLLKNAIARLLGTIAADENAPDMVVLKAALALWKDPASRKAGNKILARMLADAKADGDAVTPLLAAWEVLGKWPRQGGSTKERTELLATLVGDPKVLVGLSRLVFSADLPKKAQLDLAHAVENLFWRSLRRETDATARNRLIRAAIAFYKDFDGYFFQNDPDFLAAASNGTSISEAERVFSNMQYWIDRLPKTERTNYSGVLAFGRAISVNLSQRKKASDRVANIRPASRYNLDAAIRSAFDDFKNGNIASAAKTFERVLTLSREQQTPDKTRALLASIIRLVDKQAQSDLPLVFSKTVLLRGVRMGQLETPPLLSNADRKLLRVLKKPDRRALADLSKMLHGAYDKALSQAMEPEVEKIILKTVNGIAAKSENATGDAGAELARLRLEQRTALDRYRIFYRTRLQNTPISKSDLEVRLFKLKKEIRAQERRLDPPKDSREKVTEGGTSLRKTLVLEMANLNLMRARRDAIQDILIARFPDDGNMIGTRRSNLVKTIYGQINGTSERPLDGVLEQLFTDDEPTGWTRMYLKDRLSYLRARRRSVMMEDKTRDPSLSAKAYLRELDREKAYWKKEGKRLAIGLFDLGKSQRELALQLERDARFSEAPTLIDQLVMSGRRGNPQKFFAFLAQLQTANLDKGLAAYTKYLETPWYRLGMSQGYYLATDYTPWSSKWNYNNVLKRFTARMEDVGAFNAALLSASRLDPAKLRERHRKAYDLLAERGFIVKGKYTLPKEFAYDAGSGLEEASKLTQLDRLVNVGSVAEALVTIIIPGKLSFAGTEYIASRWIALNGLGRLGVEAALFTGYSRAGAIMLDPSMGLSPEYWTFDAVLKDYAHNLLIMGGLQGSSALAGRFGKALRGGETLRYGAKDIMNMPISQLGEINAREWNWFLFGGAGRVGVEAATLQAIDSATNATPLTAEGFLRNIIFLAELKAVGMPFAKAVSGLRVDLLPGGKLGNATSDLRVFDRIETKENLQVLLKDYNGDWHKLVDAFKAGKVSKRTMRILTRERNSIVDGLANQVVLEIYGPDRISRQKMWDAVGSVNLTSDYDLSFKGEKSELAVLLFNERFRARWGRAMGIGGVESAGRLDTNVYTYPRYAEYRGNETDVLAQETAAQLGVRRYSSDATWQAHRQRVLDVLKGAERARLKDILDQVDRAYAESNRALEQLANGGDANARTFAANKLYGEALKRIMGLRALHAKASGAERARLAQQIRNTQAKALFFASEAYLTEAAINHVVFNTQAVGRKITVQSLLSDKQVALELPMSGNMARQSLLEQLGYLQAQFSHYEGYNTSPKQAVKLSGKLSKYFLRLLDAAHIGGVDLQPIKDLVRQTVDIEANRGNAEKLAELLPGAQAAKYDNAVKKAMQWLSGEIYRKAPISIVEPAKIAPAKATTPTTGPQTRTVSQRLVGGKTGTANPKPAATARGAGQGPAGGAGAPTSQANSPVQGPPPNGQTGQTGQNQTSQKPAPAAITPKKVVDASGSQTGWISRDPAGQAWYQPLGVPGAMPPPPIKVRLLQGGQVVSPFRKLGRLIPPAKTGKTAPAKPAVTKVQPAQNVPPSQPLSGTQSQPRSGRALIDSSGGEIGWVDTDPNGQAWFTPTAPEGTLAAPPQKVEVAPDGSVSLGFHRLGKLGRAAPPAKGTAIKPAKPAVTKVQPARNNPPSQPLTGTQSQPRSGRALIDSSGGEIGWVDTDPNGQAWFTPTAPEGTLAAPPQKVEVAPDGSVSLGFHRLGKLQDKTPASPALAPRKTSEPQDPSRAVRDRNGDVMGHVETDPNGQSWFAPDTPPGILTSPPQKVEVTQSGAVILSGRVIGQTGPGDLPQQPAKLAFAQGKRVTLVVKITPGGFGPTRPPPKTSLAIPQAPIVPEPASPSTPSGRAPDVSEGQAKGFEGLWLGWNNAIIRNVRDGDVIRGILEYAPADMTAFGWAVGDVTAQGTVSGSVMTGQSALPRQAYPQCPERVVMPFKATLDASGDRFITSTRIMLQPDPAVCTFVPTTEWSNGFWITRITEAKARELIAASKADADQVPALTIAPPKFPVGDLGTPENSSTPALPAKPLDMARARALSKSDNTACAGIIEGLAETLQSYDDALAVYERSEATGNANLDELQLKMLDASKQGVSAMVQQVEQCLKIFGSLSAD